MKRKMVGLLVVMVLIFSHSATYATDANIDIGKLSVEEKYEAFKMAGILQGYPDGKAHLERNITRAELAMMLSRLLDVDTEPKVDIQVDFVDLKEHWISKTTAISNLVSRNIMIGKGNNRFDPNGLVTIEEVAAVVTRSLGLQISDTTKTITNVKISDWAQGYVGAVVDAGLIEAQQDYTALATRAFIVNTFFMEYSAGTGTVESVER